MAGFRRGNNPGRWPEPPYGRPGFTEWVLTLRRLGVAFSVRFFVLYQVVPEHTQ